jgi:hypothetical protein
MKPTYLHFLKQLLIFSGILAVIAMVLMFLLPGKYVSPSLLFLVVFFTATSLLSFYYLLQSTEKRFIRFVNTFLLTILVKLFLYAGVMIGYALLNRSDAVPFMLGFFILYLCYSVFEAVCIINYTSSAKQDQNPQ